MKRLFLLLLLATQISFAMVVVNSLDGRDVVSGIYYAADTHDEVVFLTPGSSEVMTYSRIGTGKDILLIQSADHAIVAGMANNLKERGNDVELVTSADPLETNLQLAGRSGASSFILVDPVYGYNTVSALAYAKLNSMYLIFTDKNDGEAVVAFLQSKSPGRIMVYGYMDNEVKNLLDEKGLQYQEINNGDKFEDNLELSGLYFSQSPSKKQVILSDGNAFEATIAAGDDPVILISSLIPTSVKDYMTQKAMAGQIQVAMIVDESYAQTAYDLKESINQGAGSKVFSVFVKMGEGTSGNEGQVTPVELFQLPGPSLGLKIAKAEYNQVDKKLEITYENTGNALEYVQSSILVLVDGAYVATVGDEEPFVLGREKIYGIAYPLDVENGQITINATSYFGSSRKSREGGIITLMDAGKVEFVDTSALAIPEFTHDKATNDLMVSFANNGTVTAYFQPYAVVDMNGTKTTVTDESTYQLGAGEGRMVRFPGIVKSGSAIVAGAEYGAREAFLGKKLEKEFVPQAQEGLPITMLILGAIIILLLIAVAYLVFDRMRKK
jgi:hypothetical protein